VLTVRALAALVLTFALGTSGAVCAVSPAGASEAPRQGPRVAPFVPKDSDDARLVAAWERWVDARTPHYLTRVQRACECPRQPLVRTEVRRGRLVSVTDVGTGRTLGWKQARPMDGLYRLLRRGYQDADAVRVRYSKRGVPLRITIDWSELVADEETILSVHARTGL
jgi:hypothetical protein